MTTQQTQNQAMGTYGTHTTEACPFFNEENKKLCLHVDISVVLGQLVAGEDESVIIIGNIFHIVNGIGLTLFFGYVFMPISRKILNSRIWLHRIIFGVIVTVTTVWFGMLPALRAGVAGLNIAREVPAMTMSRHIIFGAVIGVLSKSLYEERK